MNNYVNGDFLFLIAELNARRIAMVMGARTKRLGGFYSISDDLREKLVAARVLHNRFMRGDYRATDLEIGKVKILCEWLADEHGQNNGTKPNKIEWGILTQKAPLPSGLYRRCLKTINTGDLDAQLKHS